MRLNLPITCVANPLKSRKCWEWPLGSRDLEAQRRASLESLWLGEAPEPPVPQLLTSSHLRPAGSWHEIG